MEAAHVCRSVALSLCRLANVKVKLLHPDARALARNNHRLKMPLFKRPPINPVFGVNRPSILAE
jgi:hypothetical protein